MRNRKAKLPNTSQLAHPAANRPSHSVGVGTHRKEIMQNANIDRAVAEAKRFLERAKAYREALKSPDRRGWTDAQGKYHEHISINAPLESGALRRASLDLTRALAAMRRP